MAATETIRIVLYTQAASGLCLPYSSDVYDRPERSPPQVGLLYLIPDAAFQATLGVT